MTPRNPLETHLSAIPTKHTVFTVCDARTAVWTYGPDDAATTFILVHGFRGTHHGLELLAAAMPECQFIAPDLPGFGESQPFSGTHSLEQYAGWLTEFCEIVDPDASAIVLGHSFGSMIVANAVTNLSPRRISLVNPIAENALSGPDRILTNIAIGYYKLGALLPERLGSWLMSAPFITRIMSEVMAVTRNRALRQWIHAQHHAHFSDFANRQVLLEAFRASVSDDVTHHAADFPSGTSLIVGERDKIAPLPSSQRLQAAMPGSQLFVIEGVGHLVHYETPLALARVLRETYNTGS
ncbi:alpha/beta fold hydrolase [Gulosibacter bifidus]|uniref:Alpha/beta fold hydrolase n=1 Tax=Gulosibacter bifidus TaxID=272239 RepID=A0ABW5RHI3_9MICO|nr:alpha/beta hydrolase [Gulosibacter bifidus]